jgi:creatinine amidohydrolase
MPFVTGPGTPSPETLGILFAEFIAPASDRFVADHHSACSHHLFYIAEAHAETKVVPNAFRDDFFREPMAAIQVVRHSSSIAAARSGQCDNAIICALQLCATVYVTVLFRAFEQASCWQGFWTHPTGLILSTTMKTPPNRRSFLRNMATASLATVGGSAARADVEPAGISYVNPRKVLLYESTRKEFREAIEGGTLKAVILPTGSTEQHNEHLAMINDTVSVTLIAQKAALLLYPNVIVATPVPVGISPHWMDRKGTLTLKKETFLAVVFDICESLQTHGVRNIMVLNGHGGNVAPLRQAVPEFARKLDIRIETNSYWNAYDPAIVKKYMASGKAPGHAAEFETSFAMAAFPERIHWEGVDYEKIKPHLHIKDPKSAVQEEEFAREARLATTAKGEAMIDIAVKWTAGRLRQMIERPVAK